MRVDETQADQSRVASLIDHTLLKPEARADDIRQTCQEALCFGFAAACVNPYWVPLASELLAGSSVAVCTVIGFPLGANQPTVKLAEAHTALTEGARELDVVQNIGALRSGDDRIVREEVFTLAALCHANGAILKVIIESCVLTDAEKIRACELATEAGADFVKTSTGFAASGATAADVRLMRRAVSVRVQVKASGGIRTLAALREMVDAGATRIGTSSGVRIIEELAGGHIPNPGTLNVARVPGGNPDVY